MSLDSTSLTASLCTKKGEWKNDSHGNGCTRAQEGAWSCQKREKKGHFWQCAKHWSEKAEGSLATNLRKSDRWVVWCVCERSSGADQKQGSPCKITVRTLEGRICEYCPSIYPIRNGVGLVSSGVLVVFPGPLGPLPNGILRSLISSNYKPNPPDTSMFKQHIPLVRVCRTTWEGMGGCLMWLSLASS
jgi:hypothetical protein